MAGTDRRVMEKGRGDPGTLGAGAPVVILVRPQLGENIGTAARAMLNCALTELRLVDPRDGWPNEKAVAAASGADMVLAGASAHPDLDDALADLNFVLATTARPRGMVKPVMTPQAAAVEIRRRTGRGERVGVLFGAERSGLENEDIARADVIITAPLNPGFASLNLAQAVLLMGHAWFAAGEDAAPPVELPMGDTFPAAKGDVERMVAALEAGLEAGGFFASPDMRPTMMRNLRAMILRMAPTDQDVRTLFGVIKALRKAPPSE